MIGRPGLRRILLRGALVAVACAPCVFAGARSKNEEGNHLYGQRKYDEALKRYTEAQIEAPDAPQLHYNLGNVLFRKGEVEKARDEYRRALAAADPSLDPRAVYNLGNTFFSQDQFKEAIAAYQRTLKLKPSDRDAKKNLELALLRMKQQQQPQNQSGGGKQDKDPQQSPKPQAPQAGQSKKEDKQPEQRPESRPERREKGALSKEEAERILNALQEDEKANLKQRLQKASDEQEKVEKDW
ncbi:MAG TPA: tetratricopeptide repeat protein [Candidatus Polarisedimenticolia bacterium]|nr:tetratricopeptide repeat protein [Candidatus Polarisedimenticolia bacterium]